MYLLSETSQKLFFRCFAEEKNHWGNLLCVFWKSRFNRVMYPQPYSLVVYGLSLLSHWSVGILSDKYGQGQKRKHLRWLTKNRFFQLMSHVAVFIFFFNSILRAHSRLFGYIHQWGQIRMKRGFRCFWSLVVWTACQTSCCRQLWLYYTHCCRSKSSTSHKIISQQVVLFLTRWTTDGYPSVTHCKVLTTAGKLKSESSGSLAQQMATLWAYALHFGIRY